jgi:hypothetical protein
MTEEPFETSENARRDRREHGGAPMRPDDVELARRTEQERVDAGVEDYDPDELPPATDEPVPTDLSESEDYQETEAEIRREEEEGEIYPLTDRHPFPPSHYDRP